MSAIVERGARAQMNARCLATLILSYLSLSVLGVSQRHEGETTGEQRIIQW